MRGWRRALAAVAVAVTGLTVVAARPVAAAGAVDDGARPGDPALSVNPAAVHAAMTCRGPLGGGGREPVLLVHGTFTTGGENFGWNYLPELAARGYRACTVDLPNRSLDDIQVASEHVVVAVHRMARESGRKVDVLGHSQGALEARWAVRWWPSVRAQVDDLVSLAGPNQGTTVAASPSTPLLGCPACLQMAPGSAFLTALNRGDQTPGEVSYTSIYSTLVDELITPNATAARIEGASNLELQALCPARVVTHVSIVTDAVAHAMVLDALGQPGPASAGRFVRSHCLQTTFVGVPGATGGPGGLLTPRSAPIPGTVPAVEPPLQPYARPMAAAASRARTSSSTSPALTGTAPAVAPVPTAVPPTTAATAPGATAAPASALVRPTAATESAGGRAALALAVLALAAVAGAVGGTIARRT